MSVLLWAVLLTPIASSLYFLWHFLNLLFRQARSPLRHLPGPRSPSVFIGNLREMHDQENTNLVARWASEHGPTFVYRGFVGGYRLMTTDPVALNYIMSHGYDYPKPDFVRDSLASMAAGYEGLITAEGEMHRKQRRILNPAFSAPQIRSLTPIFWDTAVRLRDIWLDITTSPKSFFTPADPLMDPESPTPSCDADPESATPCTSPSSSTTSFLPNPFSSFVPSKASPTLPTLVKARGLNPASADTSSRPCRLDVLPWLARAALDVIGLAGFGYTFNSLETAAERRESESELARAFAVIFGTARKFRIMTVLQVWFPALRALQRENAAMRQANASMRRIGTELIEQRRAAVQAEKASTPSEKSGSIEGDRTVFDRDLLSVLIRSDIAEVPTQRMSLNEILCQISTFIAAGHETSSSSLAWTLYALARSPSVQTKLREELRSIPIPSGPTTPSLSSSLREETMTALLDQISQLPYLDAVVRESLRLYAPVTTTMRVASADDVIPISEPFVDKHGRTCHEIRVNKGDIISIPIQAMNKCVGDWGADAESFRPERWMEDVAKEGEHRKKAVQGLWGNMLTFGGGSPVNGNRSCIGYRFALAEIKVFLFVLVRDLEFSIDPTIEIEKKVNVVTRPCVKSEPQRGNQMPLYIRRVLEDSVARPTHGLACCASGIPVTRDGPS